MAEDGDPSAERPIDVVRSLTADPSSSASKLPLLLRFFEDDNRQTRLLGALGICLIADTDPDTAPAIIRRLSDRLEGVGRPEAIIAYNYIVSQFPAEVDAALLADTDNTPDTISADASELSEKVGRVRPPGLGSYDPRNVEPDPQVIDPDDVQRHPDGATTGPGSNSKAETDADEEINIDYSRSNSKRDRQRWNQLFERLSEIVEHSRFDDLMILSGRKRTRYAEVSEVLANDGGDERALALRLLDRPADGESFVEALIEAIEAWDSVGDHPNIVSVIHWGRRPRPWLATDPSDLTLVERGGAFDPSVALSVTLELADALDYAHQRGVVHGGIDPKNVTVSLGSGEAGITGSLDNFGLLNVYRWYVTPSSYLDPRYAAPEYYDRQFGQVDHATDIYQLGAVLYRLLTGRPPFRGEFEGIRDQIMRADPPEPSQFADVPATLDQIVTKAMAKRTLTRYETINDFRGDVSRVNEELTNGD